MDFSDLKRRGVAALTVRDALLPIIQREQERLLSLLDVAEPKLEILLDLRSDLRSNRRILKQLQSLIGSGESADS